jgi:hypothetical protein
VKCIKGNHKTLLGIIYENNTLIFLTSKEVNTTLEDMNDLKNVISKKDLEIKKSKENYEKAISKVLCL